MSLHDLELAFSTLAWNWGKDGEGIRPETDTGNGWEAINCVSTWWGIMVRGLNLGQIQSHPLSESSCFLSIRSQNRLGIAWTLNKDQKSNIHNRIFLEHFVTLLTLGLCLHFYRHLKPYYFVFNAGTLENPWHTLADFFICLDFVNCLEFRTRICRRPPHQQK